MTDQASPGYKCVTITESSCLKRLLSARAKLIADLIISLPPQLLGLPGKFLVDQSDYLSHNGKSPKISRAGNDRESDRISVERGRLCLVQAKAGG